MAFASFSVVTMRKILSGVPLLVFALITASLHSGNRISPFIGSTGRGNLKRSPGGKQLLAKHGESREHFLAEAGFMELI
jgi:hypothetical protein